MINSKEMLNFDFETQRVKFPCFQIWNEFVSLSEEEQEVIISRKTKTMAPDKDTNWGNTNEDRNIPTEQGRHKFM